MPKPISCFVSPFQDQSASSDDLPGESSDILSALSNEECSVTSEILDPPHGEQQQQQQQSQQSQQPQQQPLQQAQYDSHGQPIHVADIIQDLESDQLGHIDSPETSDTTDVLHGDESLMDDMSSVLAQDMFAADASFADDTMTLCAADDGGGAMTRSGPQRRSLKGRPKPERAPFVRMESEETENPLQFGFENIVFEIDNRCDDQKKAQPVRFCSLARFVEGSDIARKSFKKPNMRRASGPATDAEAGGGDADGADEAERAHKERTGRHISFDDSCKKDDGDEVSVGMVLVC